MRLFVVFVVMLSGICSACSDAEKQNPAIETRDTTITQANAYTQLFFDSVALEQHIQQQHYDDSLAKKFRVFYNQRNYEYAWFFSDGPDEQAYHFLTLQSEYIAYSGDSSLYSPVLQQIADTLQSGGHDVPLSDSNRLKAEWALTLQFFRYADKVYQGDDKLNTTDLKWFIPRKQIDQVALLDSLIANKGKKVDSYEPVNPQYHRLKEKLLQYYEIEKNGGWPTVLTRKEKFRQGDTFSEIALIKQRLYLTTDFVSEDTSSLFTEDLKIAVKKFQRRYGLKDDGVVGKTTMLKMNEPVQVHIRKMLINLERLRWVPVKTDMDYLLVNIPEFTLHVYENGKLLFNMNVVVGSTQHNTVVFRGDLKYVVFSPYWNIPVSIVKKEIMPGIKKDKNYLAKHKMEITGYSGNVPIVRQQPGPDNSLGKVKFLFPNSYNIYLHDTPAKSLFGETKRAFSHGCIRLGNPPQLAEFLLRNDTTWTTSKIEKAMNSGKEKYVTLNETVPVYIGYFTAWVDSNDDLNLRDDIYGHDGRMSEKMFEK